jgi:hypothetical protein
VEEERRYFIAELGKNGRRNSKQRAVESGKKIPATEKRQSPEKWIAEM